MRQVPTDNFDLQLLRKRAGVEQEELALALGVHPGTLSRFETGKRTDLPGGRGRGEYAEALDRLSAEKAGSAA